MYNKLALGVHVPVVSMYMYTRGLPITCTGPDRDVEAAADFIQREFMERNLNKSKIIYPHFTTATDTSNIRVSWTWIYRITLCTMYTVCAFSYAHCALSVSLSTLSFLSFSLSLSLSLMLLPPIYMYSHTEVYMHCVFLHDMADCNLHDLTLIRCN